MTDGGKARSCRVTLGDSERLGSVLPSRVGTEVVRVPERVINQRKDACRRVGYEARFRRDATLERLVLELARSFFARTAIAGRPVTDALRHYRLIARVRSEWRLTNAALLLFAHRSGVHSRRSTGIRLFRIAGAKQRRGRHRNATLFARVAPPIAFAVPGALRVGRGTAYPAFAWTEGLVNAVAHRDYKIGNREIEVRLYDDRVEITNPGGIAPPASQHALSSGRPSRAARNSLPVSALAGAGLMCDEGEGVPAMFGEMREHGLPPPQIAVEHGVFTLTLRNGRDPEKRSLFGFIGRTPSGSERTTRPRVLAERSVLNARFALARNADPRSALRAGSAVRASGESARLHPDRNRADWKPAFQAGGVITAS